MGRTFNPHDCISALNNTKQALQLKGSPFSKEVMLNSLKGCGLPINSNFWSVFRKSGILQEVSKGRFMFTSKDPIFIGKLVEIQKKYQELSRHYSNNRKNSAEPEKNQPEKVQAPKEDSAIQAAVNLLKEHNYLVFAPTRVEYTLV